LNENSRADTIIIATVDNNTKKLKITSFLRDTYVEIPKHSKNKINASYALGGPNLLMETIERNFRIKVDRYIVINFWGFENVVDYIGGLDIDIKQYEVSEINKYIGELDNVKSPSIAKSGLQHLDGQQVLAYARIRRVGNGSYERTQRQRNVLTLMAQKLKDMSIVQYPTVMSKMLPYIRTNIEPISLVNYAYTVSTFKPLQVEQLQMPMTELSKGKIHKGTWVFLMDREQNAKVLNDFIFRDKLVKPNDINKKRLNRYLE
jgi:LCP family protein required for cell wall assembly